MAVMPVFRFLIGGYFQWIPAYFQRIFKQFIKPDQGTLFKLFNISAIKMVIKQTSFNLIIF